MAAEHLATYLERAAREHPSRTAVVDGEGTVCTYRELDDRAGQVAAFLRLRDVKRGDRVGVALPKSTAHVAILSGVLRAGAVYVPVDWTCPAERNATILADCSVRALFAQPETLSPLRALSTWNAPETVVDVTETTLLSEDAPSRHASNASNDARDPDDLAYILYTSGSTGSPKGVALTHRNVSAFLAWCATVFAPAASDRFGSHAPFHFDLSVLDLFLPQRHGAAVHLVPDDAMQSPRHLARWIARSHLTVWYSTPTVLSLLAQYGELHSAGRPALRLVLFAGEVFPIHHLRTLTRQWPHPAYYNLYGPTETNVCTFAEVSLPIPDDRTDPWPIGRPCGHCEVLVLDESGREAEEGLLHVAGPSVFGGYWNRPDLDARAFHERSGKRWYDTGDVVRARGCEYLYVGRRDRMVKRRGHRIELGEIESALHRCRGLREAAVVASGDADGVRIIAYVAREPASGVSAITLKSYCASALPASMSPDRFEMVDALPRTPTGKIDYAHLTRAAGGA